MSISETTRRNIVDFLRVEKVVWRGRLDAINFLERIFNLKELPSTDGRFREAYEDIWKHTVINDDWESDWVYDYAPFDLLRGSDKDFLNFLCEMIHPIVRADAKEVEHLVGLFNDSLRCEGWELIETISLGGRPVFSARQNIGIPGVTLEVVTNVLNTDYVMQQVNRMQSEVGNDPTLAIGTAKEFVETVCKSILNERLITYDEKLELQPLVKLTCQELGLVGKDISASVRAAETIRKLLNNFAVIAQCLAELRNPYGTGHGKGSNFRGLQPRHARLAVNAAQTVGVFLFETHLEKASSLTPSSTTEKT
ncbi:MAG: abortive infection family protein [Leptolyngbyaceae cyanobacterium CSU_1_4]|nr:abortive infection family protein [Leptolyngbyaceae cyanobacterium CSU_1_4]